MDQNTQLKTEFFELIRLCNKSNLKLNQKTTISFFIETNANKLILCATANKNYKVQLISKYGRYDWTPCGFSGLNAMEEELSKLFRHQNLAKLSDGEITKIIKSFIFKQLDK